MAHPPPQTDFGVDLAEILRYDGSCPWCPIGTDKFMLEFANVKTDAAILNVTAVSSVVIVGR